MRTQTQSQMAANGSWKVGPTIGLGATATVSLAAESNSGDLFAVKSSLISRSALLQKEHSILSSLSSPHIISCHSFANSGEFSNLFLELAAGGALSALAGHLDELKIRSFTRQILLGLSYIHSKGIAHCDVKGSNVLLCSDDLVKLADFGCARWDGDGNRLVMGTPAYMAPEAVRGEEQGIAGDVWSLGCTVVEMATGKSPWPEAANPVAAIHQISFSSDIPAMPEWVSDEGKDFVSKCLMRDPEERWTAEQLLCHPFVLEEEELCSSWKKGKWVSPKSTMEFDLWDSETEEDEQEKEEEVLSSEEVYITEGIRQLESPPANWGWDDSWIEVRTSYAESDEIEISDNSECSCSGFVENGFEDVGLWRESKAAEVEELGSVSFAGEAEAEQGTEHVWSRCNCNFDDTNKCQISYWFIAFFSLFYQLVI
ncbi:mitogen-activated protein kinase kinase kinase ANP1-like [Phalaenopsis equestris]|uniref:mitogen-activated protein kinase kinase kinase ANP1-like n=1 Tax=Phalaenopsis equestris TaxID=78828 RepID=UPI0009E4C772|nr:mitogen-activated protein kinase kinase kinase ANP1-like [Phalaenopsis equestris]